MYNLKSNRECVKGLLQLHDGERCNVEGEEIYYNYKTT